MASRYPTAKVFDYCLSPIHIVDDGKDVVVPCGKCNGCLLHKANEWSMRLADEIQYTKFPVFTTLTYDNKYLPKLIHGYKRNDDLGVHKYWFSDHKDNIRCTLKLSHDGRYVPIDKVREDHIVLDYGYEPIPISNFSDYPAINYASKRDVQLYNKLLRKLIYEQFPEKSDKAKRFRYFCISEYGPTTYRGHIHAIYLFNDKEVSEYFTEYLVYTCWSMCDKNRIIDYTHYCTGGASNYLTQYVNSVSCLPKVYQENKEVRPFRLTSKACAIGFNNFSKEAVSESYLASDGTYVKSVASLGQRFVFRFPKGFISSVFPKCREFSKLPYWRLRAVYSLVYVLCKDCPEHERCRLCELSSKYDCTIVRLRENLCAQDFNASMKCYKYCVEFGCVPEHYLYVLDMVYYKKDMFALKLFYEYQQKLADRQEWLSIARLYSNFNSFLKKGLYDGEYQLSCLRYFLDSLSIDVADIDTYNDFEFQSPSLDISQYEMEVNDILADMVKTSKFNEMTGSAPTII